MTVKAIPRVEAVRMVYEHLSPEGLEEWLASKDPIEIIGYAGEARHCPLARYMHDKTGVTFAVVGPVVKCWVETKDGDRIAQLPTDEWVYLFIRQVDGHKPKGTPIRVYTARACLDLAWELSNLKKEFSIAQEFGLQQEEEDEQESASPSEASAPAYA